MPKYALLPVDFYHFYNLGLEARKPVFGCFLNNKGADQPAHPHSLVSTFVIHLLAISYLDLL